MGMEFLLGLLKRWAQTARTGTQHRESVRCP